MHSMYAPHSLSLVKHGWHGGTWRTAFHSHLGLNSDPLGVVCRERTGLFFFLRRIEFSSPPNLCAASSAWLHMRMKCASKMCQNLSHNPLNPRVFGSRPAFSRPPGPRGSEGQHAVRSRWGPTGGLPGGAGCTRGREETWTVSPRLRPLVGRWEKEGNCRLYGTQSQESRGPGPSSPVKSDARRRGVVTGTGDRSGTIRTENWPLQWAKERTLVTLTKAVWGDRWGQNLIWVCGIENGRKWTLKKPFKDSC